MEQNNQTGGTLAIEFPPNKPTIEQRFNDFDANNPHIYREFKEIANVYVRNGQKFSAKAVIEVVRWEKSIKTTSSENYKINNDFTSRYARKYLQEHPEAGKYLETRVLKAS